MQHCKHRHVALNNALAMYANSLLYIFSQPYYIIRVARQTKEGKRRRSQEARGKALLLLFLFIIKKGKKEKVLQQKRRLQQVGERGRQSCEGRRRKKMAIHKRKNFPSGSLPLLYLFLLFSVEYRRRRRRLFMIIR